MFFSIFCTLIDQLDEDTVISKACVEHGRAITQRAMTSEPLWGVTPSGTSVLDFSLRMSEKELFIVLGLGDWGLFITEMVYFAISRLILSQSLTIN